MNPKAANLARLRNAGFPVPEFVVVRAGDEFELPHSSSGRWSVRSSAPSEDSPGSAQAGRHTSHLDVAAEDVPARVAEVCAETGECIVQAMLEPEWSGVLFTANPNGLLNQSVLAVGPGAGAVVGGEEPAYRWWVAGDVVEVSMDAPDSTNTPSEGLDPESPAHSWSALSPEQVREAVTVGARIAELLGTPADVELAWQRGTLWVLQARPITTLETGDPTVLDNSNLVESYPGISLPLTIDFAVRAYRGIYRGLARRVLGRPVELPMVTGCTGRLYYRLDHHYRALALLPGARWLVPVWERSMGLPHRADRTNPWSRRDRARAAASLVREFATAPSRMRRLDDFFRDYAADFPQRLVGCGTLAQLHQLYVEMERDLVEPWSVTLVNDLHAFFWTAAVQRVAGPESLSGVSDLESMRPVRALAALRDVPGPRDLSGEGDFARAAHAYIDEFGDRYLAELKLESPTFRTRPDLLLEALDRLGPVGHQSPPRPPRGRLAGWLWKRAADGARNREVSRLNRSRIFGFVRSIALRAGELHAAAGRLEVAEDVFWVRWDELFREEPVDVTARKAAWGRYAQVPDHERLVFAAEPFDLAPNGVAVPTAPGELAGEPASPGVTTGPVCIVREPSDVRPGAVLVTASTDPGWVFLVGQAAAVISERGSLLSHTAIVAREFGVPLVVGARGATSTLHNGEIVEVNGTTGHITRKDAP